MPVISNQRMNAYLKEIADVCGIAKRLTTHVARHTAATVVFSLMMYQWKMYLRFWDIPISERHSIMHGYWIAPLYVI